LTLFGGRYPRTGRLFSTIGLNNGRPAKTKIYLRLGLRFSLVVVKLILLASNRKNKQRKFLK